MIAIDHATWARSNRHRQKWVESADRAPKIDQLRQIISDPSVADVRIDGVSGVGKTRLVLEALRSQPLTPLVAYIGQADALTSEYVNHLLAAGRSVVVVVDECPARRHEKIAEQIPHGEAVKLVSLGEPDPYAIRAPIINLSPLSNEGMDEFLKVNYGTLWPEARRVIVDLSDGNPRFAILLADKVRAETAEDAAALIQANDVTIQVGPPLRAGMV